MTSRGYVGPFDGRIQHGLGAPVGVHGVQLTVSRIVTDEGDLLSHIGDQSGQLSSRAFCVRFTTPSAVGVDLGTLRGCRPGCSRRRPGFPIFAPPGVVVTRDVLAEVDLPAAVRRSSRRSPVRDQIVAMRRSNRILVPSGDQTGRRSRKVLLLRFVCPAPVGVVHVDLGRAGGPAGRTPASSASGDQQAGDRTAALNVRRR